MLLYSVILAHIGLIKINQKNQEGICIIHKKNSINQYKKYFIDKKNSKNQTLKALEGKI